ncbi:MAG TPA: hypothetical protein VER39_09085 [Nocardioidaceae bacterium]|nr:hypothetical protein [Nocardioidaceae bacterium]
MYDMYPEWGPARHRLVDPADSTGSTGSTGSAAAGAGLLAGVQAGLDLRDNGGQRPDDN